MKKRIIALVLVLTMFFTLAGSSFAYTAEDWDAIKWYSGELTITPGADETSMNFAWLSSLLDKGQTIKVGTDQGFTDEVKCETNSYYQTGVKYVNHATAYDLEPDTTYYYQIFDKKGAGLASGEFKTAASNSLSVMYVADPQIGRSGDSFDDDIILNDLNGWNDVLNAAVKNHRVDFILCGGDQVNEGISIRQYNAFFAPDVLRTVPVASAIGNHDFYYPLYSQRFNHPNAANNQLLTMPAGSDYYFSSNGILFIVLDSNNPVAVDHQDLIEKAIASHPDAKFRVVMQHHSIYSRAESDSSKRTSYGKVFDKYDIDLVLSGHDHVYIKTKAIRNEQIDESGTVYLQASSASGSRYGDTGELEWYMDAYIQPEEPSYSMLTLNGDTLEVNTYTAYSEECIDSFTLTQDSETKNDTDNSINITAWRIFKKIITTALDCFKNLFKF